MAAVAALVCFLVLYPILTVVHGSFQKVDSWGDPIGYSLYNYGRLLEPRYFTAIINSLIVSAGTCALAGFLGVTLAWIVARTNSFGVRRLEPFNLIPFYLSPLIGAIAWTFLASPSIGFLNQLATTVLGFPSPPFNIYSLAGIIWVLGLFYAPYMYLFTVGSLQKMDPALEDAARTAGAGMLETMLRVTLPLTRPGLLCGLSLTFVTSMGGFAVPAALGIPVKIDVLASVIFTFVESDSPDFGMGATLGMIIFVFTLITFLIQRKLILRREFTTVTGKGFRPTLIDLGRWRYLTFGFHLFFILTAVVMPILAIFIVSISRLWTGAPDFNDLTLSNYSWVLFEYPVTQRGIRNSLFLSFTGATVGMALCFVLAYIIHKLKGKAKAALDLVATLPISMPSIVLAMGILIAYIKTPLYMTIWIIMLAYITRYIPVAVRTISAVLLSISQELEDSSQICGATWLTTVRRILFPLLKPGLLAGWLLLFLIFMRELNASILLYSAGNEVMAVVLFFLLEDAPLPQIAAYAMIQTIMILVIVYFVRRVAAVDEETAA
jgi:iron(III) transport system permease protein